MKTSELTGPALDWAVAKCSIDKTFADFVLAGWHFNPSTNWAQGGAIIERERIRIEPRGHWVAAHDSCEWTHYSGPTPLIAAMRCYVASKLGDEVDVPAELIPVQSFHKE